MVGFGPKLGWLAVPGDEATRILEALGGRGAEDSPWRAGVDSAYRNADLVVATPPLPGADGRAWTLVCGRYLLVNEKWIDPADLSTALDREVQFFATYRVSELHRWERAIGGTTRRSFRFVGEIGEVTDWRGDPDDTELQIGLPARYDPSAGAHVMVGEQDVLRVAKAWSVDPTAIDGRPAPAALSLARL